MRSKLFLVSLLVFLSLTVAAADIYKTFLHNLKKLRKSVGKVRRLETVVEGNDGHRQKNHGKWVSHHARNLSKSPRGGFVRLPTCPKLKVVGNPLEFLPAVAAIVKSFQKGAYCGSTRLVFIASQIVAGQNIAAIYQTKNPAGSFYMGIRAFIGLNGGVSLKKMVYTPDPTGVFIDLGLKPVKLSVMNCPKLVTKDSFEAAPELYQSLPSKKMAGQALSTGQITKKTFKPVTNPELEAHKKQFEKFMVGSVRN